MQAHASFRVLDSKHGTCISPRGKMALKLGGYQESELSFRTCSSQILLRSRTRTTHKTGGAEAPDDVEDADPGLTARAPIDVLASQQVVGDRGRSRFDVSRELRLKIGRPHAPPEVPSTPLPASMFVIYFLRARRRQEAVAIVLHDREGLGERAELPDQHLPGCRPLQPIPQPLRQHRLRKSNGIRNVGPIHLGSKLCGSTFQSRDGSGHVSVLQAPSDVPPILQVRLGR
mmetsp:Transcript_131869/g.422197  ORF Transcript_131869/g.422197 Transcript_131869/m.422197 type:complete len:230 (+) Transcript_131869:110-799(+)